MPRVKSEPKKRDRRKTIHKPFVYHNPRRAKNVAKKKFAAKRRPFVEIKGRSHEELYDSMFGQAGGQTPVDNVYNPTQSTSLTTGGPGDPAQKLTLLPLWSFMNPVVGTSDKDMLGRSLTAKYLTCRVTLRPPTHYDPNQEPLASPRLYLIHGWMTNPINNNAFTNPSRESFTRADLLNYLSNHVSQKWKDDGDKNFLQFREKSQLDIKILGYKRIKIRRSNNLATPPTIVNDSANDQQITLGQNPRQDHTIRFNMNNRKVKYSYGTNPSASHVDFLYPNDSWIPFVLLYQPDHEIQPNGIDKNWQVLFNNKLWFSDS